MGLDNAAIKMKREGQGWVEAVERPEFHELPDGTLDSERYLREMAAVRPLLDAEEEELKAAFAHLPSPFDDGGYLRGKGWAGVVSEASGLSLYAELLTPDAAGHIAQALSAFDWEPQIARNRSWWQDLYAGRSRPYGPEFPTVESYEQHFRTTIIPGLIGYFQTCAECGYGIVSWY